MTDELFRTVVGALSYTLNVAAGSRLPVPPWVREVRDRAVAALHERDAEVALETLADSRTKPTVRAGGVGSPS